MKLEKVCMQCGKTYFVPNKEQGRKSKFCSIKCRGIADRGSHKPVSEKHRVSMSLAQKKRWENESIELKQKRIETLKLVHVKHHSNISKSKMSLKAAERMMRDDKSLANNGWKTGYFYSEKNKKNIFYRSSWELKLYELLEKSDTVLEYITNFVMIPYLFKGCQYHYIPDVLIKRSDKTVEMVEVKPEGRYKTNPKESVKIMMGLLFCHRKNIPYTLISKIGQIEKCQKWKISKKSNIRVI